MTKSAHTSDFEEVSQVVPCGEPVGNRKRLPPCRMWSGRLDEDGYGIAPSGKRGLRKRAHRVEWEKHFGSIPDGLEALHLCDSRACIEIHHLVLGTQTANMFDRERKRRGWLRRKVALTPELVLEIWNARHEAGSRVLARRFGCSRGAVNGIVEGRTWRHVTGAERPA